MRGYFFWLMAWISATMGNDCIARELVGRYWKKDQIGLFVKNEVCTVQYRPHRKILFTKGRRN